MWPCPVVLQNKTWGWISFVGVDKAVHWAPWKTDRRALTDGERVTPTARGQLGSGYYGNPLRIILWIKGRLDSLGLPRQGTWLGLCQPTDKRLVCSCVIWQSGCVQTALCCGDDITLSLTVCVCKPVAHQRGRQWEPPVQATSSGIVCVREWRELKNNNKTDENCLLFIISCSNSSKQGTVIKYSSLIGADFSNVSSSHPWYNTGINKHQVGQL